MKAFPIAAIYFSGPLLLIAVTDLKKARSMEFLQIN